MVKRYLLGVGAIIGIFAFNSTSVYADDVNMSVNLAASAALVLPSTPVNLAIEPTAEGRFSSGSFNVTAYSNSPAGYTLTMTTTSVDLTSDTYNAATETYPVISTLSDSVTASTFELNKWGISLDGGTTYIPMTTERTLADTTSTGALANGEVTTIGIGTKLDLETVPGKYSTTINFALVAQPLPTDLEASYGAAGKSKVSIPGGGSYYSMQDMTSEICANSTESELQVVDTRDNKVYWILKAKDGKCWMTQNLDFDIPSTALTSNDTDLTQYGVGGYTSADNYSNNNGVISWTPMRATYPASSASSSGEVSSWNWSDSYNSPYSIDTGDWYWTDTWYNSAECDDEACYYLGNATEKFSTLPYTGNGKHGHVGNLYNWAATIASNNGQAYRSSTVSNVSDSPQNSICPSGWRLPTFVNSNGSGDSTSEFKYLTNLYINDSSNKEPSIIAAPLWFVRNGNFVEGTFDCMGHDGHYWTNVNHGIDTAHEFQFWSGGVYPDERIINGKDVWMSVAR